MEPGAPRSKWSNMELRPLPKWPKMGPWVIGVMTPIMELEPFVWGHTFFGATKYPSSHNHGSWKRVPLRCVSFTVGSCSTSMIMGGMVYITVCFFQRPISAGFCSKPTSNWCPGMTDL